MYRIKWFSSWSLRRMLAVFFAAFLLLAALAIAANVWIATRELDEYASRNAEAYLADELVTASDTLSSIRSALHVLASKEEVTHYLQADAAYKVLNARNIVSTLNDILRYVPQISNVAILSDQGQVLESQLGSGLSIEDYLARQKLFETLREERPTRPLTLPLEPDSPAGFAVAVVVPVTGSGAVCVALSRAEDLFSRQRFVSAPYAVEAEHGLIAASGTADLTPTAMAQLSGQTTSIGGIPYSIVSGRLAPLGWRLIMSYHEDSRVSSIESLLRYGLTYFVIFAVCGAILAALLYVGILHPIRSIHNQTLSVRIQDGLVLNPVEGSNELSGLAQGINELIVRAGKLGQEINQANLSLVQAELARMRARNMFLQAQINPHFLYNMLGCICGMASVEGAPRTREISSLLATLYRYNVDRDEGTLEDEMECVTIYHQIINLRYGEAYAINCQVPEDLLILRLPRMILEPIVENAVQHGFVRGRMERGTVSIKAALEDDLLQIDVCDDGCGMRAPEMASLNEKLDQSTLSDDEGNRIGLFNVNSRIKLYYGSRSGLHLSPGPEGGLRVSVRMYMADYTGFLTKGSRQRA